MNTNDEILDQSIPAAIARRIATAPFELARIACFDPDRQDARDRLDFWNICLNVYAKRGLNFGIEVIPAHTRPGFKENPQLSDLVMIVSGSESVDPKRDWDFDKALVSLFGGRQPIYYAEWDVVSAPNRAGFIMRKNTTPTPMHS